MIDYTRIIDQIMPKAGGEDVLRLRGATVDAVNSDGTVDIIISGIVVPNVVRLSNAAVTVGESVQVLVHRGLMLVLGPIAARAYKGTYSPTITGTGGNPVINGTSFLTGKWWRIGRQVTAIIDLFIDSDEDFGGSSWRITLPFSADTSFHTTGVLNATSDNIGNYKARSNTASESSAGSVLLASATTTIFYPHATGTSVGAANFTTTARLKAQVNYIAAS